MKFRKAKTNELTAVARLDREAWIYAEKDFYGEEEEKKIK